MKKAVVGLSGGVDSSVAALLLQQEGYEVIGVTLRLHGSGIRQEAACNGERDIEDAAAVCRKLHIRHEVYSFQDDFTGKVVEPFCQSYIRGETPNPCVLCNRTVKFPKLFEAAEALGAKTVATGHYARILQNEATGLYGLYMGKSADKDQSYVLYHLTQKELCRLRFPVGELTKKEVRELAGEWGLINESKPDSMDICFVPDGDYTAFIQKTTGYESRPGNFTDADGNILGRHRGLICYTTGQRKGLGVSADRPLYVLRKNIPANTVVLGDNGDLYTDRVFCRESSFIGEKPSCDRRLTAKIRYSQTVAPCRVIPGENSTMLVEFEVPQRAATAGQFCVLYDGEQVIGGGIMTDRELQDET